jgi:hypothetical protein
MVNAGMPSVADGPTSWVEWIGRASAATLMAAILITGYFGVWRWGGDYTELKADRDEWKSLAMRGAHIAAHAANRVSFGNKPPLSPPTHESPDAVRNFLGAVEHQVSPK